MRAATGPEIAPAATACPAANAIAASIVRWISGAGTAGRYRLLSLRTAERSRPGGPVPAVTAAGPAWPGPATAGPRRCPPASRAGLAASLCPRPSMSHRTTGVRYFAGNRLSSRSIQYRAGHRRVDVCLIAGSGMVVTCLSRDLRRAVDRMGLDRDMMGDAVKPVRQHLPGRTDPALRARTRKAAWKASSASWWSREDAPADAQDHRPVPADDGLERRLVAAGDESFQQLAIRKDTQRLPPRRACTGHAGCRSAGLHAVTPNMSGFPLAHLSSVFPGRGGVHTLFSSDRLVFSFSTSEVQPMSSRRSIGLAAAILLVSVAARNAATTSRR